MSVQHGTLVGYKIHHCRCAECTRAQRDYNRNRHRQIAYGRWETYIDSGPVRAHVESLQASGLGWKRIAALAGLSSSTVWKLLYGDPRRGSAPSKRVRPETAAKLFAVSSSLDVLGGAATVDATGTQRRIQALVAIGWSQQRLAERIGMLRGNFGKTMRSSGVQARTARAVKALYEELWDCPPPEVEWRDKISANRSRGYAAEHGWVPPLAWDDESIDDPAAQPHTVVEEQAVIDEIAVERALDGEPVRLTRAEAAEVSRIGTQRGMSANRIAKITGRTSRSIQRYRAEVAA